MTTTATVAVTARTTATTTSATVKRSTITPCILISHLTFTLPTGQEFRALFISTVRTVHTCKTNTASGTGEKLYLEFLTDPKLLNTAVTRARSLVAVVGDPVSLCTVGDCRDLWKDYIKRCNNNGGLQGTTMLELEKEITASVRSSSLNPDATPFTPKSAVAEELHKPTKQSSAEAEKEVLQQYIPDFEAYEEHRTSAVSVNERKREENKDQSEKNSEWSNDKEECADDQEVDSVSYDGFQGENLEDATIFQRYMDEIIKALVSKCEETLKKDSLHRSMYQDSEFPPLQLAISTAKPKQPHHPMVTARVQGASAADLAQRYPSDYKMRRINGRDEIYLVNPGFQQTPSAQARNLQVSSRYQECLQPEDLRRLLLDDPNKYLACSLRLSPQRGYSAYGEIQDTDTADIQINGRVRQAFDRDTVVIEMIQREGHIQGKIIGKMTTVVLFLCSQLANIRSADFETHINHLKLNLLIMLALTFGRKIFTEKNNAKSNH